MFEEPISARLLLTMLEIKHQDDVCVSECKTGPTHSSSSMQKLDLWVMPKSWSKPWISGYEIKVNRSDFLKDDKWPGYLPYCNLFSFVCPWGLIQPEETPEGCGLYWASKNCERLYTKRRPPLRHEVKIPDSIFRYVLMNRVRISAEYDVGSLGRAEYERFLKDENTANKLVARRFKDAVSKHVKRRIGEIEQHAQEQERENQRLKKVCDGLAAIKEAMQKIGVEGHGYWGDSKQIIGEIRGKFGLSKYEIQRLNDVRKSIDELLIRNEAEAA